MKLTEINKRSIKDMLFEYKRDITANKMGNKLLAAAGNQADNIDDILVALENMDPTGNKMYTEWIARQFIAKQFRLEDAPRISEILTKFEGMKRGLEQKDINKYSFYSLEDMIDKEHNVELSSGDDKHDVKTDMPKDVKVLYNGPLGLLAIPETEEASCELGHGTSWCTARRDEDNKFETYASKGPLYTWIGSDGKKYQFHFDADEMQFMDAKNRPIDNETIQYFKNEHPVLKKFFASKEKEIMKDPIAASGYAKDVIKGRWPEAEAVIKTDLELAYRYADAVIGGRWPEAEPYIMKNLQRAYEYAKYVIKGRWSEAEPYIMQEPSIAYDYVKDVIGKGKRWLEAEPYIKTDPFPAYQYAKSVIKKDGQKLNHI